MKTSPLRAVVFDATLPKHAALFATHRTTVEARASRFCLRANIAPSDQADYRQTALIALTRAIASYAPDACHAFEAHLATQVQHDLVRHREKAGDLIRRPGQRHQQLRDLAKARRDWCTRNPGAGREPSDAELVREKGWSTRVIAAATASVARCLPLDAPVSPECSLTWASSLGDDAPTPREAFDTVLLRAEVRGALNRLPSQDQQLLNALFGLDSGEPLTRNQLAARLALSHTAIHDRKKTALAKLRRALGALVKELDSTGVGK